MREKTSAIFVVILIGCALQNSLCAQDLNGYSGIWYVQTPGALFRKISIMPVQNDPSVLGLTLWYACPEGLCIIPDISAEVIGGDRNNLLVAEVQYPGKSFSFPLVIYRSSPSNSLHVRVKQDVDYTQLFTYTQSGRQTQGSRPVSSEPKQTQVVQASPEPSPRIYEEALTPREVYREEGGAEELFSESTGPDPFAEFSTADRVAQVEDKTQESQSVQEVQEGAGKIILPHCFSCPSYQLKVYNQKKTLLVDPKMSASRRWECELPKLPEGEYTLEVILKRGFGDAPSPPYREGNIQIGGEEQEYLSLVLQRY